MELRLSDYSRMTLNRTKTLELLDKLSALQGDETLSIYLPSHLPPVETQNVLSVLSAEPEISRDVAEITAASKTGAVLFRSNEKKCLVIPPFPITEKFIVKSINVEKLRSLLTGDYIIALVLVRLGSYAIGVVRGEKLISSKVGTGLVHGRHRQGGSSSHRFERHRDKQIETFLNRVDGHIKEHIGPYVKNLNYIVYGGARTTILLTQKYCPMLMKLETPVLPPLLDIPDPRQAVLETAVERVWSSTIVEWKTD
jgi:hypothetical protein